MAKFKVGDRVVSIKTGRKGKIVSPGGRYNPMYGHYGHHEMWNVWFDDEKERIPVLMGSEEIRLANSRACNAKFKVGDVVSVKREAAEMIDNPALARKRGRVTKVLPGGYYEVDGELGATGLELTDAELILANSCRSTNAVVAKALNACARNADGVPPDLWEKLKRTSLAYVVTGELKKGKSVDELIARFRKSGPGSQIPGRAQDSAIAASVLEEMKRRGINACGTARNAGAYDIAGEAGRLFKDAYNDLAGCAAKLERLTTLGQPDDVPGNDNKIAIWAKDKTRKVRDIMNKLNQGRL